MKKFGNKLKILGIGAVLSIGAFAFAAIPNDYYANYELTENYEKIIELFVWIEATNNIGQSIEESVFGELNSLFEKVFPYFPEDYEFNVVFEQCLLITEELASSYNYMKFTSFMDNCYKPFQNVIKTVNNDYTVIASSNVNPQSWPAPLNVTFDGRASFDPSDETVPSSNFYRYYRDVDGVDKSIGIGPVVNYTFDEPGNYRVHLTVRSSNKSLKWIFDGEISMAVDVSPKSAIISIYANGQKLSNTDIIKIGVQEAQRGVIFDASATIPIWWRRLEQYVFEVISSDGFKYTDAWEGSPGIFTVPLPDKWEFTISLTTIDNEWNKLTEKFSLVVADPVAIIKQTPDQWDTTTKFTFDANTSYSVVSRLRLYTWEIYDQNGNKLETFQWKKIDQEFLQPGAYTIKLTVEDDFGKQDISTTQIVVESTPPIPQFTITPRVESEEPSEFILDASLSSDLDELNGYDELGFERVFSEPESVEIVEKAEKNERLWVRFNRVWVHTIILKAKDKFGKQTEISKEIEIISTLRPQLFISPVASVWWQPINFVVKSNEEIISYQWDFDDWNDRTTQTNRISHLYENVGIYEITLDVIWLNGMTNKIEKMVFIWEKNKPIAAYTIFDKSNVIMTQNESCSEIISGEKVEHPAYMIDRYEIFRFDVGDSVNAKWEKNELDFYFQQKNDEIYKEKTFISNFNEVGCQFVDLTVEDTSIGKNDQTRVWFKVVNALPVLDNIFLYFPQYGNEMKVWFQENNIKDIFSTTYDPLMVKLVAQEAEDPDGFISYFKRYYYYKDDPTRVLETKITPWDIPYVFFSLPRIPGEFMFGVMIYDSDDGKQRSEHVIGNWPIVFFPPDVQRPDIPLVTLKADKLSAEVWDEITFDVITKVISDKADFDQERTIQYDFDWDGEWDFTTKKDRVKHIYTTANEEGYTPRVAVLYRGYKWIWKWGAIVIKKWLKPRLMFNSFNKYVIFRDVSIGEIEEKKICLNSKDCKINNDDYILTEGMAFDFEYPEYKKYVLSEEVKDKHANSALKRRVVELTGTYFTESFYIQSIPETTFNDDKMEIFVGKNLDNSVLFNVHFNNQDNALDCYVDADIARDSDEDGIADQDRDFNCNQLHMEPYEARYDAAVWRVYYQVWDKLVSKDFTVNFLDFEVRLEPAMEEIYEKVSKIITSIDTTHPDNEYLKTLLISLKEWLIDEIDTKSNVVSINDYIATHKVQLTQKEKQDIEVIITELSDSSVIASQWWNEYEQAKADILWILPHNLANDVKQMFYEFENTVGGESEWSIKEATSQQDKRKEILQDIVNLTASSQAPTGEPIKDEQIDPFDMEAIILPSICRIMNFYTIPSELCGSDILQALPQDAVEDLWSNKDWMKKWVKTLFVVLGILIAVFVTLVVIFAMRAKMAEKWEEGEEEEV